jgi:uncharacterized protein YjbJ (UPF0337 family)
MAAAGLASSRPFSRYAGFWTANPDDSLGEGEVAAFYGFWQCQILDRKVPSRLLSVNMVWLRSNNGSSSMGWDEIERDWNELKGEVKRQWSKLSDEDVELIKGKYAELLGLLQERYGHAKERAEREINDWAKRLKVYSAAELTALGNDVGSLSASVGDLVRRQAAAASGPGSNARSLQTQARG